ncbi:MAG: class A beta-lactamase-related serine hydrolase [Spirochaetaceae bacterium]|nr:MAG: class A beta-lactamase-related serine hydrolase [Spirochaetaceae bacterium]
MKQAITALSVAILMLGCASAPKQEPTEAGSTVDTRPPLISDATVVESHLNDLMNSNAHYGRFSGTVLVARGDTVVYHESFGYRDYTGTVPNTNDTVYGIGSVMKQFTAAGVLTLVNDGLIELHDPVSVFFPELGTFAEQITIHHLLSMSSGILEDFARTRTYDLESVVLPQATPISTTDLVGYFGEVNEYFRPGRRFDYANINYVILAALIEQISGTDLHSFLTERLWLPRGLESVSFGLDNADTARIARPLTGLPIDRIEPEFWHDSWVLGAGGGYSNVYDLYRWMKALNDGEIFDRELSMALVARHQRAGAEWYGYGWTIGSRFGRRYHYHEGGTVGFISEAGYYPEEDIYVVMLANHTHELESLGSSVRHMQTLSRQVHAILAGEPFVRPPVPEPEASPDLAGRYGIAGFDYELIPRDAEVAIRAVDGSPSIVDIVYARDLQENSRRFRRVKRVARALAEDDFGAVWWRADTAIRIAIPTGLVADAWKELTGDKGAFVSANVYRLPTAERPNTYWVRLVNAEAQHGVFVTLNRWGRVRAMQLDPLFSWDGPLEVNALAISPDRLFVDGFRHGYADLHLTRTEGAWTIRLPGADFRLEAR